MQNASTTEIVGFFKGLEVDGLGPGNVKKIMKGINVVYHCAATAHEGLSVFSPYEISKNNFLASVS